MSIPAFSDIAKLSNDLLSKDFYHTSAATLEVKSTTANGVAFKVNGKSTQEKTTTGALEAKYTDKPSGIIPTRSPFKPPLNMSMRPSLTARVFNKQSSHNCLIYFQSGFAQLLIIYRLAGLTVTQTWNTANALESKIELNDNIAKGLKAEVLGNFFPSTQAKGVKLNLHFKQPNFHTRAFFDLLKGPTANLDAVIGHDGFLVGAEAGYDVQKAAVTKYSLGLGYQQPLYTASIIASNNLSVFSASYYHKVNSQVEAGAKAIWDSKSGSNVGLEVASKYRIDPLSFTKAKINDRGIAAVSYNVLLREGVTLGLGASFDTQKLDSSPNKIGASFTFEA
ncbi:mitochondrial outer membrane protein porin [Pseudogymnoascus sp. 05NY08]|nr:mitochondrial outer membrane protein porin [Pseudogymnoascus sp. 05NY08]